MMSNVECATNLLSSEADLFSMFNISEPVKLTPKVTKRLAIPKAPRTVPLRGPAIESNVVLPPSLESIGCTKEAKTKTVVVCGNLEGDGTRLEVVLEQSKFVASKAKARGNVVVHAFIGNCAPGLTVLSDGCSDAVAKLVELSKSGVFLDESTMRSDNVVLISGTREIAWLILANSNVETREICNYDHADANAVLERKAGGLILQSHNKLTEVFSRVRGTNAIAVSMLVKLILLQEAIGMPALVANFARKCENGGDESSLNVLKDFLARRQHLLDEGISELFDGNYELTPEGVALVPACKSVVKSVLDFANYVSLEYVQRSHLIQYVENRSGAGIWLSSISDAALREFAAKVDFEDGAYDKKAWAKSVNKLFQSVVSYTLSGEDGDPMTLWALLQATASQSTCSTCPFKKTTFHETCSSVLTSRVSAPFGSIQRKLLLKEDVKCKDHSDVLAVLEQFANLASCAFTPSFSWAIATWCGATARDLESARTPLGCDQKLSTNLKDVSETIASLLSLNVGKSRLVDHDASGLRGIVGPTTQIDATCMRMVRFLHDELPSHAFIALFPNDFIRYTLEADHYDFDDIVSMDVPKLAVEGFVVLPDSAIKQLGFPGVSEADIESMRTRMGTRPRLWSLSSDHISTSSSMQFMSKNDVKTLPGFSIFHVRQTLQDTFAGLNVRLVRVPGNSSRMTLIRDTPKCDAMCVLASLKR